MRRLLSAALVAAFAAAGAPALAATKIAIGYVAVSDFMTIYIAKEEGFFAQRGLDAELTAVPLSPMIPPALVAGSIQIGMSQAPPLLQARDNGLDMVVLAGNSKESKDNPQLGLVASAASGIAKATDLKGKKVGVPGFNSFVDALLRKWLVDQQIDVKGINFVEVQMPQLVDAMKTGVVDAIATVEPFRTRAISTGNVKISDYVAEGHSGEIMAFWIATRDWAKANPEAITAFRAALADAVKFIADNPEKAKADALKYIKVLPPRFANFDLTITPKDFDYQAGMAVQLGMINKPADIPAMFLK